MATVTGFTASHLQDIVDSVVVTGEVVGDDLHLTQHDGTEFNAGNVRGPTGATGVTSATVCTSTTRPTGGSRVQGMFIYETDSKLVFMWDGTNWIYKGGTFVCTSSTRPTVSIFAGLKIFETDTKRELVYTGTIWMPTSGGPPGCIVTRTTAQAIASGSNVAIQFNATDIRDTDSFHDTATNNTRMTVPANMGGLYEASGFLGYVSSNTGYRTLVLNVNGTSIHLEVQQAVQSQIHYMSITGLLVLAAGDYVELVTSQNSGGSLNTDVTVNTRASLTWMGFA